MNWDERPPGWSEESERPEQDEQMNLHEEPGWPAEPPDQTGLPRRPERPPGVPTRPRPPEINDAVGCGGFLAMLAVVAALGVGIETYDYVSRYDGYNPPQAREYDPLSWIAAPLAEAYEEGKRTP